MQDASVSSGKKIPDNQVYIVGDAKRGQKDLLLEAESTTEANEWAEMVERHIRFCNAVGGVTSEGGTSEKSTASYDSSEKSSVSRSVTMERQNTFDGKTTR